MKTSFDMCCRRRCVPRPDECAICAFLQIKVGAFLKKMVFCAAHSLNLKFNFNLIPQP